MNKKMLIGGAVALAVVAGGAAFFLLRSEDEIALARNAIEGNGEATCTFTDPNTEDTGTLYVKDGNMRIVVNTKQDDKSVEGNYLLKDKTGYFWTEGEKQGFKFAADQAENVEGTDDRANLKDLSEEDFKKEYEKSKFSCKGNVDQAMLEVPGNVEFTDFSSFSEDLQNLQQEAQQNLDGQDLPSGEELEKKLRDLEQQYNY